MSNGDYKPISVGEWIVSMLIAGIPLVGFIMLCIWGFGSSAHPSKATWAKASLIVMIILFVFYLIFGAAMFIGLMGGLIGSY